MMAALRRMNTRLSETVYEYYKQWAVDTGATMSAVVALALEAQMNQRQTIGAMEMFKQMLAAPDGLKALQERADQAGEANP